MLNVSFCPACGAKRNTCFIQQEIKKAKYLSMINYNKLTVHQGKFNIKFRTNWFKFNFIFWHQSTKTPQLNRRQSIETLLHIKSMWQFLVQTHHQMLCRHKIETQTQLVWIKLVPWVKLTAYSTMKTEQTGQNETVSFCPITLMFHFAPTTQHCGSHVYLGQDVHQANHRAAGLSVKVKTTNKTSTCKQDDIISNF